MDSILFLVLLFTTGQIGGPPPRLMSTMAACEQMKEAIDEVGPAQFLTDPRTIVDHRVWCLPMDMAVGVSST